MRFTLKFKLGVVFTVILIMAAISSFMGIQALQTMDERLGTIVNREVALTGFANDIIRNQLRTQRTLGYLVFSSDAAERRRHEAAIDELRLMIDEGIDQAYAMSTEGGRELLDEIRQDIAAMRAVNSRVIELARLNRTDAAGELLSGDGAVVATKVAADFDALLERYEGRMAQSSMEASELYAFSRNMLIMLLVGMVVIAVVAATWVILSITRGVASSVSLAQAVASGDLNATAQVKSNDEIKDLVDALNAMAAKLREVVGEVSGAVRNVASGSQEMAATSEQLSQGATEQAASAEEASSSMEQMTANIKQSADNASQTESIARDAANDAEASGRAVTEAVGAMETIAEKILIVQEIARQTDLLALNAAVEAARAGEHGRGFAVVAAEVRKLAERSQAASQEISGLSGDTVKAARSAGEMLAKLVPDIQKSAELIAEISLASNEQNEGAAQINVAIQQLDRVTQQNTSAAEEMSATAEELSSQAEQLQAAISYFRLDEQAEQAQRAALPAPARSARPLTLPAASQAATKKAPRPRREAADGGFAFDMREENDAWDAEFKRSERA